MGKHRELIGSLVLEREHWVGVPGICFLISPWSSTSGVMVVQLFNISVLIFFSKMGSYSIKFSFIIKLKTIDTSLIKKIIMIIIMTIIMHP